MIKYKFVEKVEASGQYTIALKLLEGKYEGLIFSYDKVEFVEHGDENAVTLKFGYEIHRKPEGLEVDFDELEYVLGGFLTELIQEQLGNNELIFTGGTDENRESDPIKPDSQ
jgi:hypothetical protein